MPEKKYDFSLIPDWKSGDAAFRAKLFADKMEAEYFESRQKWPAFVNYNHGITVLVEEFLELVKDTNEGCPDKGNSRMECVQAAAALMAFYLELL